MATKSVEGVESERLKKKDCNQTQKSCPKLSELISLSISLLQSLNCTLCGPQTGAIANFDIFYLGHCNDSILLGHFRC